MTFLGRVVVTLPLSRNPKSMKKIRITWNGQLLREVYPHATKWQVFKYRARRFFNRVLIVMGILAVGSGIGLTSYAFGQMATNPSVTTVTADDSAVPVLQRIASCEEYGEIGHQATQINPKNGQAWMMPNKNGTVDVGAFMVNSVWFSLASKMNLDLTKFEDNKTMAVWIYHNKGTGDWSASQKCWQK